MHTWQRCCLALPALLLLLLLLLVVLVLVEEAKAVTAAAAAASACSPEKTGDGAGGDEGVEPPEQCHEVSLVRGESVSDLAQAG